MRQVSVFSTSFGPRPGASVPTTSTGGVSSGNVSTVMRGVTTAANTTSAMQIIRIAIGLRSESRSRLSRLAGAAVAVLRSRRDRVAVRRERAPFGDDERAGARAPGRRTALPPRSPMHCERASRARRRRRRRRPSPSCRGPSPRRAGSRSPGPARRRRCATSPVVPTGIARVGIGDVDLEVHGARRRDRRCGARRAIVAVDVRVRSRSTWMRRRVPGATTAKSISGASATMRTVLRSTTDDDRVARAHERAGIDRARRRPRRRTARAGRSRSTSSDVPSELRLRARASCACFARRSAPSFCSASFGETKPPSSRLVHARRLVRRAPAGSRRARAPASRRLALAALALRQSSVASTSPRLTTAPGPHEHRVDVGRDELRPDLRLDPRLERADVRARRLILRRSRAHDRHRLRR